MAIITLGANAITALPTGLGGKILQVVTGRTESETFTSSSTASDLLSVNITPSTTGLKATFVVTNNGASVMLDQANNEIEFDSGPFSVSFEVINE